MSHSCMLSFYSRFLIINTEANYWKILHIKINHVHDIIAEKWCSRFHQSYMLLCRIDTCFSFLFIKYVIGVWTTDLFWEIFSTPKFIGCFKIKTFLNNITVLENMSDGHISILEKRKKYVTSIILRFFLEILSYWKEKSFDITNNTIPI